MSVSNLQIDSKIISKSEIILPLNRQIHISLKSDILKVLFDLEILANNNELIAILQHQLAGWTGGSVLASACMNTLAELRLTP